MEQLELFTTFNGNFVYEDDIYALGMGDYLREKDEYEDEQDELQMVLDDYHPNCFACGLSYADTVSYQESEEV